MPGIEAEERQGMNRQSTEGVWGRENTLYDIVMMDICNHIIYVIYLTKFTECIVSGRNLKVNYELWVIMVCQCKFILGKMYHSDEWC